MIFLNSASSAAALVFYLPCVCTHTDTEGKQRKARVWNILKSSEKNTIINEHPVCNTYADNILSEKPKMDLSLWTYGRVFRRFCPKLNLDLIAYPCWYNLHCRVMYQVKWQIKKKTLWKTKRKENPFFVFFWFYIFLMIKSNQIFLRVYV